MMIDTPTAKRKSRTDRTLNSQRATAHATSSAKPPTKLDQIEALLLSENGASIAEMVTASGWQQHSVRGAMAGALKKRGLVITSEKIDGTRRYRAERSA